MKGKLIVFEGIDGSGKTTLAKYVVKFLEEKNIKSIYTYEPYDPQIIKLIESKGKELGAVMEALLLAADRFLHVNKVIKPYMEKGYYVVCDRYYFSSIAYQGARGADREWIKTINYFIIKPNLSIYLDVTPEIGLSRLHGNLKRKLRYLENVDVLRKVREIYLEMVSEGKLIYVNAMRPLNEVMKDVKAVISSSLKI